MFTSTCSPSAPSGASGSQERVRAHHKLGSPYSGFTIYNTGFPILRVLHIQGSPFAIEGSPYSGFTTSRVLHIQGSPFTIEGSPYSGFSTFWVSTLM